MAMPLDSQPDGSYSSPPPMIRFDVINQAFALFQQQVGPWILIALVFGVVSLVAAMIIGMVPVVGAFLGNLPAMILMGGFYKAALKHIDGGVVAVADLFDINEFIGPLVVAGILVGIGTSIGTLLCIIPGIIAGGLWMFTQCLIVDQRSDGVVAMRTSWNALRSQWLMAGVFYLVILLLAFAGMLACGIGLLVTGPVAALSVGLLYRDFFPAGAQPAEPPFMSPGSGL